MSNNNDNNNKLVELKNGETYNGHLANIDLWMNVNLKDVIRTSKDGDEFWRVPEIYIRGNTIKYLRVPDAVLDAVAEEKQAREAAVRKTGERNLRFLHTRRGDVGKRLTRWCVLSYDAM